MTLPAQTSAPGPASRGRQPGRRFPRRPSRSRHRADVTVYPHFRPVRAAVHDVSRGGLGLLYARPFSPGTVLAVRLVGADPLDVSATLLARVVHATPQGRDRWRIGCEFVRPVTEEELQDLL